jgi:hypothetical protein
VYFMGLICQSLSIWPHINNIKLIIFLFKNRKEIKEHNVVRGGGAVWGPWTNYLYRHQSKMSSF